MRQRRETVEHPFGTMKARMGVTHFLTKTLPKVETQVGARAGSYRWLAAEYLARSFRLA